MKFRRKLLAGRAGGTTAGKASWSTCSSQLGDPDGGRKKRYSKKYCPNFSFLLALAAPARPHGSVPGTLGRQGIHPTGSENQQATACPLPSSGLTGSSARGSWRARQE